jgi:thiol-disulfide isomerase/thioredoxin
MKKIVFLIMIVSLGLNSCKNDDKAATINESPLKNFNNWWVYHNTNINFTRKFIPADENLIGIDYELFLKKLLSGNYICVSEIKDNILFYRLKRINSEFEKDISSTIKNIAERELFYLSKKGTNFPEFKFKTLNGNYITNDSINGKKLIVKCWFINCKSCIEEFPILNDFTENNSDIMFLGLTLNNPKELMSFLQKKKLNYINIPNQNNFIKEELNILSFPTHILVNENGVIERYFESAENLINYYNQNKKTIKSIEKLPPPPPPIKEIID